MLTNYDAQATDFAVGQTVRYQRADGTMRTDVIAGIVEKTGVVFFDSGDWCYIWNIEQ